MARRKTKKENDYYISGGHRKQQIYNWYIQTVRSDTFLNDKFNNTINLVIANKREQAITEFTQLTNLLIDNQGRHTIGYLIEIAIDLHGKHTIITDLFNGIIGRKYKVRARKQEIPKTSRKKLDELNIEKRKGRTKRFGISTNGKRKEARLQTVLIKDKPQLRLVDLKTGRYLKKTKSFKKEVEKTRSDKK